MRATGDNEHMTDITWRERAVMVPLLALIVFIGVYPKPLLDRIQPSVDQLISHVENRTGYQQPSVAEHATGSVCDPAFHEKAVQRVKNRKTIKAKGGL